MMIETGRTDSATHLPTADINQQLQGYPQARFPGSIVVVDTPKGRILQHRASSACYPPKGLVVAPVPYWANRRDLAAVEFP